jgi:hypothetical protein
MVPSSAATIFGTGVRGSRAAGSPAFESWALEFATPLSELRRRCDTSTNFHYNQVQ